MNLPPKSPSSSRSVPADEQGRRRATLPRGFKFSSIAEEDEEEQSPKSVTHDLPGDGSDDDAFTKLMYSVLGTPPLSDENVELDTLQISDSKSSDDSSWTNKENNSSFFKFSQPLKSNESLPPRKPQTFHPRRSNSIPRAKSESAIATNHDGADMYALANDCLQRGDYDSALSVYEAVLHNEIIHHGPFHANVAEAREKLGDVHVSLFKYERAAQLFNESFMLKSKLMGRSHLQVAIVLAKLGNCQVQLGHPEDAHRSFRTAMKVAVRHVGDDHPMVANIQSQLASLYFSTGDYMAALGYFEDALDVYQSLTGTTWLAAKSETLCNIGSVQLQRKHYKCAIRSFSEALEIQREVFGLAHPSIVRTLDNLGYSYSKQKEYSLALAIFEALLHTQLSNHTFNVECYETLKKLNLLYEKVGDLIGAYELTREAYALQNATLEPHDDVLSKTRAMLDRLSAMLKAQPIHDTTNFKGVSRKLKSDSRSSDVGSSNAQGSTNQ
jgi:tetratricopeptide (TPR) repeat protein